MSCASAASSAAHGQGQVSGGLPAPARAQATVRRRTQRNAGWPPSVLTSSTPGKPCTARRGHMLGHNCGGRRTAGPRRCRAAAGPQVAAASRAAPAPATSCRRRPAKATHAPPRGHACDWLYRARRERAELHHAQLWPVACSAAQLVHAVRDGANHRNMQKTAVAQCHRSSRASGVCSTRVDTSHCRARMTREAPRARL